MTLLQQQVETKVGVGFPVHASAKNIRFNDPVGTIEQCGIFAHQIEPIASKSLILRPECFQDNVVSNKLVSNKPAILIVDSQAIRGEAVTKALALSVSC